jgi:hypothetical protein
VISGAIKQGTDAQSVYTEKVFKVRPQFVMGLWPRLVVKSDFECVLAAVALTSSSGRDM